MAGITAYSLLRNLKTWETIDWLVYGINTTLFIIGAGLGFYFVVFEKICQIYYLYPANQNSLWVKEYLKAHEFHKIKEFIRFVLNTDFSGINRSIINSILFHAAWLMVAIFSLTSTVSHFGQGLVMGLGLYLVVSAWGKYRQSWQVFAQSSFWQVSRQISDKEAKYYLYIITGVFIALTLLSV